MAQQLTGRRHLDRKFWLKAHIPVSRRQSIIDQDFIAALLAQVTRAELGELGLSETEVTNLRKVTKTL